MLFRNSVYLEGDKDFKDAYERVKKPSKSYYPDEAKHEKYQEYYREVYSKIYNALKDINRYISNKIS